MPKYRKKPVVIEAVQWHDFGDHPKVERDDSLKMGLGLCEHCRRPRPIHGRIKTLEGWHIVCPGDWIIMGVKGEHYPCKPDVFEKTYESVS